MRKWRLFEVMQQDDARQVFTVISFPRRRSADCGEYFTRDNVRTDDFGTVICDDCYDWRDYSTCYDCGRISRDNYWNDEVDDYLCGDCERSRNANGAFHEYSYKPEPEFHMCDDEKRDGMDDMAIPYFGVELEIDGGDDHRSVSKDIQALGLPVYCKHDGSLDDEGVECVTHPCIELTKDPSGSYSASVTDTNGVLNDFDFSSNSGSGITFSQQGNTLTITATAEAAKELSSEKTYSATGSAYGMDPDAAVLCWYDSTGKYQSLASYTGVGRDPVKAYIKIRATVVEETGGITVYKVDVTGTPLSGAELLLEVSPDGNSWTEISRITTGADGIAKWEELTIGAQYRITEVKAPAGYSLLTEPLAIGVLTAESPDITVTACNNTNFALPFTGSCGFIAPLLFAALMLSMGVYFCKKAARRKTAG